jgi:Uma2 family endonuclease
MSAHRFTVAEYHKLVQVGILTEDDHVELLEGHLVHKLPRDSTHDSSMDAFEGILPTLLPSDWFMRCQRAITLSDSEPEPDYAIVRGPRNRYRNEHPTPPDIGLIVEFSVSSLRIDRVGKARIYARAGIPIYWIVNVIDKVIEVYTQPSGPTEQPNYANRDEYAVGTSVPVILDGNTVGTIVVADVVG